MAVYTVHQRTGLSDTAEAAARGTIFIRDGFYWLAFVFPIIWLAAHRLWLALLGYIALLIVLQGLALLPGGELAALVIYFALALLTGFEAGTLHRWTLARAGWSFSGIVSGGSLEDCERRFFAARHPVERPVEVIPTSGRYVPLAHRSQPDADTVLGVFPTPESL